MHKVTAVAGLIVVFFMTALWFWAYTRRPQIKPFLFLAVLSCGHVVITAISMIAAFLPRLYVEWFAGPSLFSTVLWTTNLGLIALNTGGIAWLVLDVLKATEHNSQNETL